MPSARTILGRETRSPDRVQPLGNAPFWSKTALALSIEWCGWAYCGGATFRRLSCQPRTDTCPPDAPRPPKPQFPGTRPYVLWTKAADRPAADESPNNSNPHRLLSGHRILPLFINQRFTQSNLAHARCQPPPTGTKPHRIAAFCSKSQHFQILKFLLVLILKKF